MSTIISPDAWRTTDSDGCELEYGTLLEAEASDGMLVQIYLDWRSDSFAPRPRVCVVDPEEWRVVATSDNAQMYPAIDKYLPRQRWPHASGRKCAHPTPDQAVLDALEPVRVRLLREISEEIISHAEGIDVDDFEDLAVSILTAHKILTCDFTDEALYEPARWSGR